MTATSPERRWTSTEAFTRPEGANKINSNDQTRLDIIKHFPKGVLASTHTHTLISGWTMSVALWKQPPWSNRGGRKDLLFLVR